MEKTLESPLGSKEIKQSILNEVNPEYSLERLMLKLQYFGQYMVQRADSLEMTTWCGERLKVGGEEGDRGCDG